MSLFLLRVTKRHVECPCITILYWVMSIIKYWSLRSIIVPGLYPSNTVPLKTANSGSSGTIRVIPDSASLSICWTYADSANPPTNSTLLTSSTLTSFLKSFICLIRLKTGTANHVLSIAISMHSLLFLSRKVDFDGWILSSNEKGSCIRTCLCSEKWAFFVLLSKIIMFGIV